MGRRLFSLILLLGLAVALPAIALARPYPGVPKNPADRLADRPIDPERYDYAKRCLRRPSPGALALQRWLQRHARGRSWGIMRCERLRRGYSLHSEGRAIDWRLSARSAADRREARRLILLLLAKDKAGNVRALARRMGIQEIIWDCGSWWAGSERMGRYSLCYDGRGRRRRISETLAHRDHMHIGLNLPGARKRTTFWRGR